MVIPNLTNQWHIFHVWVFGCFRAFQHLVTVSGHGRYTYPIGKLHVESMFHGHPLVYHKVVWKIYVFLRCRCRRENFWRCKRTHESRITWIFTCMRMAGQFEKVPNVADTTPIFATIGDFFTPIIAAKNKNPYVVRHAVVFIQMRHLLFSSQKNLHQDQSHQKKTRSS